MFIRYLLVFSYIFYCVKLRANASRFFQLNASYFNDDKGYYSKLDIDRLIPDKWRLNQCLDDGRSTDFNYPVFFKPEWGQNSHGIRRADNPEQLDALRRNLQSSKIPNVIQEAATELREYEVFSVLADDEKNAAVLTVSEAINPNAQCFPINSIKNDNTIYCDLTPLIESQELEKIWQYIRAMGRFAISRVGLRANSLDDLIDGRFHIIEINLFVPMPIHILDPKKSLQARVKDVLRTTRALAKMTLKLPPNHATRSIFYRKWRLARKNKLLPLARS